MEALLVLIGTVHPHWKISEAMVAYECTTTQTIPEVREQKGSHQTNILETVLEFV